MGCILHSGLYRHIKENDVAPLHLSGIFPTGSKLSRWEIHTVALQSIDSVGHGNTLHDLFEESVCLLKRKGCGFLPPLIFTSQLVTSIHTSIE